MTSIQHTVQLLDTTTAFDEEERGYWKELLPSMTSQQLGKFTQILEGHETRLKAFEEKHGKKKIQDLEDHLDQGYEIYKALRPGATTIFAIQKGCSD